MTSAPPAAPERDPRLERLLTLTDGVYAIDLTLLALQMSLPEGAADLQGKALLASLLATWPKVLGYLTSFTVIAVYWAAHHRTFQFVRRFDGGLLWLQLLQLGCISFLPFPTAVLGEHVGDPVAQLFYWGSLLLTGLVTAALWRYVSSGHRLVDPSLSVQVIRHYNRLTLAAPVAFLLIMGLIVVGVGRIVNPILLGYLLALGYIILAVYEWWEPREALPHAQEPRPPHEEWREN
ncbi:MAG: TMEM175 family protein [Actinomycetota bacterium]|nr:TMEM175 family protein [Actinomycetota bacterium]